MTFRGGVVSLVSEGLMLAQWFFLGKSAFPVHCDLSLPGGLSGAGHRIKPRDNGRIPHLITTTPAAPASHLWPTKAALFDRKLIQGDGLFDSAHEMRCGSSEPQPTEAAGATTTTTTKIK